jgi:hypothetical protein
MRKNITEVKGKDGDEEKGKKFRRRLDKREFFYVVLIPVGPNVQKTAAFQTLSSSG